MYQEGPTDGAGQHEKRDSLGLGLTGKNQKIEGTKNPAIELARKCKEHKKGIHYPWTIEGAAQGRESRRHLRTTRAHASGKTKENDYETPHKKACRRETKNRTSMLSGPKVSSSSRTRVDHRKFSGGHTSPTVS